MAKYAYIFVERNMGHDYAYAYPPLGLLVSWRWSHGIYDSAKQALNAKENALRSTLSVEEFKEHLASGISVYSYNNKHTVYSVKIAPDTLCPDPRAQGRYPYFVMHTLIPGAPEVFSKRFGEFCARCQDTAWHTMRSGEQLELKVEIPQNLYH